MSSLNKVILIGRLGADPEMRYTADGAPVATFNMATSESWKDKNSGAWQEKTEWHRVVAWRNLAERAEQLKKGNLVYVEGKIQSREFEGRDGNKRKIVEIVANTMKVIIGERGERDDRRSSGGPRGEVEEDFPSEKDDDVPL
ncbi:MAG: single-stranded DNA-binding protein [Syntrophorhabdaceae bacterium]|nr:single-stranded DNA-binding protein [Syntrophorhabdaceae bacterium]MDD5242521.1 single-stranded DNA-binding protein [Syntrophorhabdaceae bacterium]